MVSAGRDRFLARGMQGFVGMFLASVLAAQSPPAPGDVADAYWNQERANGNGDGFVDVAPVVAMPEELWRTTFEEILAGPVVWGDNIYCLIPRGRQSRLVALDADTGALKARVTVGKTSDPRLAVWQGLVVLCLRDRVATYRLRGTSIHKEKDLAFQNHGMPCVAGRQVFLSSTGSDLLKGFDLDPLHDLGTTGVCEGRPSVLPLQVAITSLSNRQGYLGKYLSLRTFLRSSPEQAFQESQGGWGGLVNPNEREPGSSDAAVVFLGDHPTGFRWYVRSSHTLSTVTDGRVFPAELFDSDSGKNLSPIAVGPILWDDQMIGFDPGGSLIAQDIDGGYRPVLAIENRPHSMLVGPLTRARGVAYTGNMALDLDTDRVLWCAPDLHPVGPLIPLADRRLLFVEGGDLVCAGASSTMASAGAGEDAETEASQRISSPADADGAVLSNGTFRPGIVRALENGRIQLTAKSGEKLSIDAREVAALVRDDEVELLAEQYPLVEAFRTSLESEEAKLLESCFDGYLRAHLGGECRRILVEYLHLGLSKRRHDRMLARLAGRSENTSANRDKKIAKVRRTEDAGRARILALYHDASSWCARRSLLRAATLLEGEVQTFAPELDPDYERIAAWIPPTFPFRTQTNAASLWLRWAREIVPAGAHFLTAEDPLVSEDWRNDSPTTTLALATRSLLLLSRSSDPEVVGLCLRSGEGAVRMLTEFFPESRITSAAPMEVRLHESRESYLAELKATHMGRLEWSAGYFNPQSKASTFHVPEALAQDRSGALETLRRVLVHELTHQFLSERAGISNGRGGFQGTWSIEGTARFFEDQAVELGRRDRGLDDETVPSVDATSLLLDADRLIPLSRLLTIDANAFDKLEGTELLPIQLRYTLERRSYSERDIFYDESGALVFFLMSARPEARPGMMDYLRAVYTGTIDSDSWQRFGFESMEELEEAFHAFLRTVGS